MDIPRLVELLKLLGDRSRLTILALLRERELCVCEIVEALGISQPAVSQHLRKLRAYDLVMEARRGQWVYYSLNTNDEPVVEEILRHVPSQHEKVVNLNAVC